MFLFHLFKTTKLDAKTRDQTEGGERREENGREEKKKEKKKKKKKTVTFETQTTKRSTGRKKRCYGQVQKLPKDEKEPHLGSIKALKLCRVKNKSAVVCSAKGSVCLWTFPSSAASLRVDLPNPS